jgi:hypothetical protein
MLIKIQNLIKNIATKQIQVNKELYKVVDDFYLQRINKLPLWAQRELEKMV